MRRRQLGQSIDGLLIPSKSLLKSDEVGAAGYSSFILMTPFPIFVAVNRKGQENVAISNHY